MASGPRAHPPSAGQVRPSIIRPVRPQRSLASWAGSYLPFDQVVEGDCDREHQGNPGGNCCDRVARSHHRNCGEKAGGQSNYRGRPAGTAVDMRANLQLAQKHHGPKPILFVSMIGSGVRMITGFTLVVTARSPSTPKVGGGPSDSMPILSA